MYPLGPVSYTHLDVYKRQGISREDVHTTYLSSRFSDNTLCAHSLLTSCCTAHLFDLCNHTQRFTKRMLGPVTEAQGELSYKNALPHNGAYLPEKT